MLTADDIYSPKLCYPLLEVGHDSCGRSRGWSLGCFFLAGKGYLEPITSYRLLVQFAPQLFQRTLGLAIFWISNSAGSSRYCDHLCELASLVILSYSLNTRLSRLLTKKLRFCRDNQTRSKTHAFAPLGWQLSQRPNSDIKGRCAHRE